MSLQLAAHLVHTAVVTRGQMELDLLESLRQRLPLFDILHAREPRLVDLAERSLNKLGHPAILAIRPNPELCGGLPEGLCRALLAVPVHRDPRTGLVDVAAVDPLDIHVPEELGFHLNLPVRVLRAPYQELLAALGGLRVLEERQQRARRPLNDAGRGGPEPETRGAGVPAPEVDRERAVPPRLELSFSENDELDDPDELSALLSELEAAQSSRDVVAALVHASGSHLGTSLVFVLRDGRYVLKGGGVVSRPSSPVTLDAAEPSVLRAATREGSYTGSLPATPAHGPIFELLPAGAADEVYAVGVRVRNRVALVLVVAGFSQSELAVKVADELAVRAGAVLERLIMQRKLQR